MPLEGAQGCASGAGQAVLDGPSLSLQDGLSQGVRRNVAQHYFSQQFERFGSGGSYVIAVILQCLFQAGIAALATFPSSPSM